MKTLDKIPYSHPQFLAPTKELARWLWGHLPKDERLAKLDDLLKLAKSMNVGETWPYPKLQVAFELVEKDDDEDDLFWWTVERKPCEDYTVVHDGERFYVMLSKKVDNIYLAQEMPDFSISITTKSSVFGLISIVCSREALLAGYNPAFCVHEYCLENNIYQLNGRKVHFISEVETKKAWKSPSKHH